jgi:predicted AAA+ superfamily ATPase
MNIDLGSLVSLVATSSQATVELPTFIFMDELTYAKDWDLWLKTFYDENRPLTVIGSSSSTAALRQSRIESGIGRWEEQYLAPYLFGEFLELFEQNVEVNAAEHLGETIRALQYELDPAIQLSDLRRRFLITGGFTERLIAAPDSQDDEASLLLE